MEEHGENTVKRTYIFDRFYAVSYTHLDVYKRQSEWGVLLKGKGNCQGYAKAYALLLQKVHIPVKFANSYSMMHMWNVVRLQGKWYHVDLTWDDPLNPNTHKDQPGLVLHENFLCSTSYLKKKGYRGIRCKLTTSSKYDHKYWKQVNSCLLYTSRCV